VALKMLREETGAPPPRWVRLATAPFTVKRSIGAKGRSVEVSALIFLSSYFLSYLRTTSSR